MQFIVWAIFAYAYARAFIYVDAYIRGRLYTLVGIYACGYIRGTEYFVKVAHRRGSVAEIVGTESEGTGRVPPKYTDT